MNTDDLRNALADEADRQPAISATFEGAIARRVRRQRALRALTIVPLVAIVVLVGAVLAVSRGGRDATVQAADGGKSAAPPATVIAPVSSSTTTEYMTHSTQTVSSQPSASTPTSLTPPTPSTPSTPQIPSAVGGACGTVTVTATRAATFDTGPFNCFLKAINAAVPADLTVIVTTPDGGSFTDRITTTGPGRMMTVTVQGAMAMKLPAISFGNGGGPASGGAAGTGGGDCGTIAVTATTSKGGGAKPDMKAMQCLIRAFLGSDPATLKLIINDQQGGAITTAIDLSGDHLLSVTTNGSITIELPADLQVPEDLINAIPPGNMGLSSIPGLNGFGPGGGGDGKNGLGKGGGG